jgi:predicted transcriptional regulator
MNDANPALLLSLRPRCAAAVLAGEQTVEVRRTPVRALPGTLVVLYATAPTSAVVGTARLVEVQTLPTAAAWERHHGTLGLSRPEFDDYCAGIATAHLLVLRDAAAVEPPMALDDLRRDIPFRPPRSFRYLRGNDPPALLAAGG